MVGKQASADIDISIKRYIEAQQKPAATCTSAAGFNLNLFIYQSLRIS